MSSSAPEIVWYENTEQGTFHEIVKGSDTERRLKRDMYLEDPADDSSWVPMYRQVDERAATRNPEKQPGYVEPAAPDKTPEELQAERDAEIQAAVDAALAARDAEQKSAPQK